MNQRYDTATTITDPSGAVDPQTGFDASYASRRHRRNRKKLTAIANAAPQAQSLLDIGCNAGYITRTLLERGKVKQAIGVELDRTVVDPKLLASDAFTLFQGSVCDYPFDRTTDITCYLAVHHHVLQRQGRAVAMAVWQNIIQHTRQTIFFEIGQLVERGTWPWQQALRANYTTDRAMFCDLLDAIGPRLKKVQVIRQLRIHHANRQILRIDLHPPTDNNRHGPDIYQTLWTCDQAYQPQHTWRRTTGSRNQRLVELQDPDPATTLHLRTLFHLLQHRDTGQLAFAKQVLDNPYQQQREFEILRQAPRARIAKLLAVHEHYGLLFEYLPWPTLDQIDLHRMTNARAFAQELKQFFGDAARQPITLGPLDRQPINQPRRLIDVVDLHPSNILVQCDDNHIVDWRVIDMAYAGNYCYHRNRRHLASIIRSARPAIDIPQRLHAHASRLHAKLMQQVNRLRTPFYH